MRAVCHAVYDEGSDVWSVHATARFLPSERVKRAEGPCNGPASPKGFRAVATGTQAMSKSCYCTRLFEFTPWITDSPRFSHASFIENVVQTEPTDR